MKSRGHEVRSRHVRTQYVSQEESLFGFQKKWTMSNFHPGWIFRPFLDFNWKFFERGASTETLFTYSIVSNVYFYFFQFYMTKQRLKFPVESRIAINSELSAIRDVINNMESEQLFLHKLILLLKF